MELRHLITFRTIVDVGGFKKAADELGYAQSSITGHIKELEKELGQPLFDRLGKQITLTQAGRNFLPYALDIMKLYSKSKEVINIADEPAGQLTIGASESLMIYWLPTIIMDFMEKYPNIELTLKSLDYDDLSSQLRKGDIDVAIIVERSGWEAKDLTIEKLRDEKLSLVQSVKKVENKIPETMLVTQYSCSWRQAIEEHIKREGNTSVSRVELPSVEAIKQCVLCGLGKSMLPQFVVKDELESGRLRESELSEEGNNLGIYAAIHKDKWLSINLEVFLKLLKSHER